MNFYSYKLLHHAKQYSTDALEPGSKEQCKKAAGVTGGLISNKIANKMTKN